MLNVFILLSVLQEIPLKATSLEKPSYASVSSIQEEQQSKERVSRFRIWLVRRNIIFWSGFGISLFCGEDLVRRNIIFFGQDLVGRNIISLSQHHGGSSPGI